MKNDIHGKWEDWWGKEISKIAKNQFSNIPQLLQLIDGYSKSSETFFVRVKVGKFVSLHRFYGESWQRWTHSHSLKDHDTSISYTYIVVKFIRNSISNSWTDTWLFKLFILTRRLTSSTFAEIFMMNHVFLLRMYRKRKMKIEFIETFNNNINTLKQENPKSSSLSVRKVWTWNVKSTKNLCYRFPPGNWGVKLLLTL